MKIDLSALEAFTHHNEFIDPTDPKSLERVTKVSQGLNRLMRHSYETKKRISDAKLTVDKLGELINREISMCKTDLELIRKQQELKPVYDEVDNMLSDLALLERQVLEDNE